MCSAIVAVTAKNDLFSIRAKHGEGVKSFITTYLFYIFSIKIA